MKTISPDGATALHPAPQSATSIISASPISASPPAASKVTAPLLLARKGTGEKITALTAYDFTTAALLDKAGIDLVLVGDSLSSTFQGHETTLPVTLEEIIYHCRCVSRAACRALIVADMPFMSYQVNPEQALISAGRLVKEGGAQAVKLEGGINVSDAISKITSADIPVIGHVGLTPQSFLRMGGHKVQGRRRSTNGDAPDPGSRDRIIEDALAVEAAGAFAVVLEGIPAPLAKTISEQLRIPTIGIGAGPDCDGQILVSADMLGLTSGSAHKFVKRYAELADLSFRAVRQYIMEVQSAAFPAKEHVYGDVFRPERISTTG